jgi:signal recognition particle GTPase
MGSLSKIFGMLPGMGEMKEQIAGIDEKEIDRLYADEVVFDQHADQRAVRS